MPRHLCYRALVAQKKLRRKCIPTDHREKQTQEIQRHVEKGKAGTPRRKYDCRVEGQKG